MSLEDRQIALLKLADACMTVRPTSQDIAALRDFMADDDGNTLAALILRGGVGYAPRVEARAQDRV